MTTTIWKMKFKIPISPREREKIAKTQFKNFSNILHDLRPQHPERLDKIQLLIMTE